MLRMVTILILCALLSTSGTVFRLKRKIYTTDPATIDKSIPLKSKVECAAWVNKISLTPNIVFNYDRGTGLCNIYKLMATSIRNAVHNASTEGSPYYVDVKCIPITCSMTGYYRLHDDPSAFPPNLAIYVPLYALTGTSLSVYYYVTPLLTEQGGSETMALSDQPFLDGSYPMWTPENYISRTTIYMNPAPTFNSLSFFAWIYITTNMAKKDHPVMSLVESGDWDWSTALGAGHNTFGDCLSFGYSASSGQYYFIRSDEEVIQRGVWQHVGATYDSDTGVATLYLNGEYIKSDEFSKGLQTYDVDQINLHHSGKMEPSGSHAFCQGCATIHQEYYKRSLSAGEVQQVYYRGYTCSYPGNECTSDP